MKRELENVFQIHSSCKTLKFLRVHKILVRLHRPTRAHDIVYPEAMAIIMLLKEFNDVGTLQD